MKNKEKNRTLLESLYDKIPENEKKYYQKKGDIAFQISTYLKEDGIKQKELANKIGMQESRLSKILSGAENLTIKTITQIESFLKKDLIVIPQFSKPKIQTEVHVVGIPINTYTHYQDPTKNPNILEYTDDKLIFTEQIIKQSNNEIECN